MKKEINEINELIRSFCFNFNQALILFSMQRMILEFDIENSKYDKEKKLKWKENWENGIINFLSVSQSKEVEFYDKKTILPAIISEAEKNGEIWTYYIIETLLFFTPYISLNNEDDDKAYKSCIFDDKKIQTYIESIIPIYFNIPIDVVKFIENKITYNLTNMVFGILSQAVSSYQKKSNDKIRDVILGIMANQNAIAFFDKGFGDLDANTMLNSMLSLNVSGVIADNNAFDDEVLKVCGMGILDINNEKSMAITQAEFLGVPEFTATHLVMISTAFNILKSYNLVDEQILLEFVEYYRKIAIQFDMECVKCKYDLWESRKSYETIGKALEYMLQTYAIMKSDFVKVI